MSIWLVVFMVFVALMGGIAIRGFRPPTDVDVDRWIARHDVEAGSEGRALVERYLGWIRRWRTAGLLLGLAPFSKWIVYDTMDQAEPWPALWLGLAAAGFLGGSVLAEVMFPSTPQPPKPEADLRPRHLDTYLTAPVMAAMWITAAIGLAAVPAYLLLADPAYIHSRLGIVVSVSALPLAAAVSIRWATTRIVERRQIATSGELLRIDHAMRSASLRTILGAGIALELFLVSLAISELSRAVEASAPHTPAELASWVGAASVMLAILAWVAGVADRRVSRLLRKT